MPVVMAPAGGRRHLVDHLPAPPPSAGTQGSGGVVSSSSDNTTGNVVLLVFSFVLTFYVCCYICHKFCRGEEHAQEQEQATSRDNGRGRQSNSNRGEAPPAADVQLAQEPVLECTYRTADGWEETMCSVCQSEMADGEKVRVLTACTHCFHTACVEQWLRDHATCPLCRDPAGAAPALPKGRRHRPTT